MTLQPPAGLGDRPSGHGRVHTSTVEPRRTTGRLSSTPLRPRHRGTCPASSIFLERRKGLGNLAVPLLLRNLARCQPARVARLDVRPRFH